MQVNFNAVMASASKETGDMTEKTTVATCLMKLVKVNAEFSCWKLLLNNGLLIRLKAFMTRLSSSATTYRWH